MKEELTKEGFINAWNEVPGYSLVPYINYCRTIINKCRPKYNTPRWLGSPEEVVEMSLADALQKVYNIIDRYDENKGTFKTFLEIHCQHAYEDYLDRHQVKSRYRNFENFIINNLNISGNASAPNDKDSYQVCAEEESKQFKQDVIKKIIKIVSDFSPRDRAIFEKAYPAVKIQEDTLDKIYPLLEKEPKIAAKTIAELFGISPVLVRTTLCRMREKVRNELKREYNIDTPMYKRGSFTHFLVMEQEDVSLSETEVNLLSDDDCLLIWALMSLKAQMN